MQKIRSAKAANESKVSLQTWNQDSMTVETKFFCSHVNNT